MSHAVGTGETKNNKASTQSSLGYIEHGRENQARPSKDPPAGGEAWRAAPRLGDPSEFREASPRGTTRDMSPVRGEGERRLLDRREEGQ